MKKLFTLSFLLLTIVFLNAQTEKGRIITGNIFEGGNTFNSVLSAPANTLGVSFTNTKVDFGNGSESESRVTTLTISPRVGYFIIDGFALGLNATYLFQSVKPDGFDDASTLNLFSVGPFVRYYYQIPNFQPFVEASFNFGQIKQENAFTFGGPQEITNTFRDIFIGLGGSYFINKTVALEIALGFRSLVLEVDPDLTEQTETSNTLGMRLGFHILLN